VEGELHRIALRPGLIPLPASTDTRFRNVFVPAGLPTLGYVSRGPHTLTASVYGGLFSEGALVAQASVSFQVGEPRLNIVYDNLFAANQILEAEAGLSPLTLNRGGVRQSARTSSSPWGASRLNGTALATQSAPEIADALRRAVDRSCGAVPRRPPPPNCAGSGLVAVDEITPAYEDWDAARRAEQNRDSPAARLSDALQTLKRRSPWGFSYASRVHLYLTGTVATNIARPSPRGPRFRQLAPGLARAGGVWIEMYTGSEGAGAVAFSKADWRNVPGAVARRRRHRRPALCVHPGATRRAAGRCQRCALREPDGLPMGTRRVDPNQSDHPAQRRRRLPDQRPSLRVVEGVQPPLPDAAAGARNLANFEHQGFESPSASQ
jgi:hypothetical protein